MSELPAGRQVYELSRLSKVDEVCISIVEPKQNVVGLDVSVNVTKCVEFLQSGH